jgi:hypothetical protein
VEWVATVLKGRRTTRGGAKDEEGPKKMPKMDEGAPRLAPTPRLPRAMSTATMPVAAMPITKLAMPRPRATRMTTDGLTMVVAYRTL